MKLRPLSMSCVVRFRVLLMACLLSVAALPAAALPTSNVGPHLGTYSVGEIQWALTTNYAASACTWVVVEGPEALPPGVALRTDVPSWARNIPDTTSAILMGIATKAGQYPFTLRVTCDGQGSSEWPTEMDITDLTIADQYRLPDAYLGQPYSYTFTGLGNAGDMMWTEDASLPEGLTLGLTTGVLSGTPTDGGMFRFGVGVTRGGEEAHRGFGLSIHPAMHITSALMPNATRNVAYGQPVAATGGSEPYNFAINDGGLPNGLSMSASGLITGTTNAGPGRYPFYVTVTDASNAQHGRSLAIYVVGVPPALPAIRPHGGMFDDCTVGVPCSFGLFVSNSGKPPFRWSASGLPPGLTIRWDTAATSPNTTPGDAEIVGVATAPGPYQVTVTVTDFDGASATQTYPLTVTPIAMRNESTNGTVGVPFSAKLYVLGGTASYSGAITAGPLPAGLSFDPGTMTVSGTPREGGGFHVDFRLTDDAGNAVESSTHFGIGSGLLSTTNVHTGGDLGTVTTGGSYWNQLYACCASGVYTWSLAGGALPDGLTLSPGGLLSGTATTSGPYTFLVQAVDSTNADNVGWRQLTMVVSPLVLSTNTQFPNLFTTTPYSTSLAVTGATGAVTWTVARYNYLPPGMTLTAEGVLSGAPAASGQYDFTLTATDEADHTLTRGFSVSVYPFGVTPPVVMSFGPDLGTWSVGDVWYGLYATGGNGTYEWSLQSGELPPGVSLHPYAPSWFGPGAGASLLGVATQAGTYTFTLRVSSGSVYTDQVCTVRITALRITDRWTLPDAFVDEEYSFTLKVEGNSGAVTWAAQNPLPPGLTMSSAGVISGTPTASGYFAINPSPTDSTGTLNRGVSLNVYGVHLTSDVLPNATQNASYSAQLAASGGTEIYTYGHNGLPWGLTMTAAGTISGTINSGPGRYGFTAWVTDSLGKSHSKNLAIFVIGVPPTLPGIMVHGAGLDDCTVYIPCSRGLYVQSGGAAPFAWTASGLPPGMSFASTADAMSTGATPGDAEIVGVPSEAGTYPIEVTVTGADGASATQVIPLTVSPMGLWTDQTNGTVGSALSAGLYVLGATGSYTGTIVAGKLPAGLSYDGVGRVTGTPLESGGFHVDFRFTDSLGHTLDTSAHFQIGSGASAIWVNNYWNLGTVTTGGYYSNQLSACCASGYTWSATTALPPGLTLSPDGLLSGTPTVSGTYTFRVEAVDPGTPANVAMREFRLIVTPLSVTVGGGLPFGNTSTAYSVPLTVTGGTGDIAWTVAAFSYLPPGLSLVSSGGTWALSGTPTGTGQHWFSLVATDEAGHAATMWFSVAIYPNGIFPPVAITTGSDLGMWSVGEIQASLNAAGGNGTYTWSFVRGTLPPGVSLRADVPPGWQPGSAGLIGIATTPGTYGFTLNVHSGTQDFERTFTVKVTTLRSGDNFGIPDASVGVPYTYALHADGVTGTAVWVTNPGTPSWVQLSSGGVITGTPPAPGWYNIPFQLSDSTGTINSGVGVNVWGLHITSSILTNGTQNASYTAQVEVAGGTAPYTFSLQGGLPNGLSMDEHGAISGTCNTGPGRYGFDVTVTDALGATHRKSLGIYVTGTPASLPSIHEHGMGPDDCTVFVPCQQGFFVQNGGAAPFTWSATGLPAGLSMGNATWWTPGDGAIIGTPTETGTFPITVTVTDSTATSATSAFMFTVSPLAPRFDNIGGTLGVPFSTRLRIVGGRAPYTGEILTGYLPTGLTFNGATGVISGTPLEPSGSHMVFRFTDADGASVTTGWGWWSTFPGPTGLTINSGPDLGYVTTGSSYSNQLSACCVAPLTWSANPADLPPGLSLSSTGLLSGTATTAGTYTFRVSASDAAATPNVVVREFTLRVTPLSVGSTGAPGWGNVDTAYNVALTATGGTGAVTWSVEPFTHLPPGLGLVESAGAWTIAGTPTATGQHSFSLVATDSANHSATMWFNVSIYPTGAFPPLAITTGSDLGTWSVGEVQFQLTASGGNGTYTWELLDGTLPAGVALRSDVPSWFSPNASAAIFGEATASGTYTFTLRVTSGNVHADQVCTLGITDLRITDRWTLPDAFVGEPYSFTLKAEGGANTVTWTAQNPLPAWMSLSGTGEITGTPTTSGYSAINVSLTDGVDTFGRGVSLNVYDVHLTSDVLPNATQNAVYSAQLAATGGTGSHTFTHNNGGLPNGLTMTSAGLISGTINTGPGRYGFTAWVTDSQGRSYRKNLAIYVAGMPPTLPGINLHGGSFDDCTVFQSCSRGLYVWSGGQQPFTWTATGLPPGMSLVTTADAMSTGTTPGDAEIVGVPSEAGTWLIEVTVTAGDTTRATQVFPLTVSPMGLWTDQTNGTVGSALSARMYVLGGTGPYTGTIVNGKLPAGLSYDGAGRVTGTPLESGGFHVDFRFTDSASHTFDTSAHFQIGSGASAIWVNNYWDLGTVTTGGNYWNQLSACCGTGYTWSATTALPPGLTLSSAGLLGGLATTAGVYTFRVEAVDPNNAANVAVRGFRLIVTPLSLGANVGTGTGNVGTAYSVALTAAGNTGAVIWTVAPFSYLPPGLSLVENGGAWTLSGAPMASGQYSFTLRATDSAGHASTVGMTLSFYPAGITPPVRITQYPGTITRSIGDIEEPLVATGGDGINYTWEVLSGTLPPGLALRVRPEIGPWYSSNTSAEIAGVATATGTYTFTVRATSGSTHADQTCVITVTLLRSTDDYSLPDAFVGQAFTFTLGVAGNAGPVTFTPNNPNAQLPPGLSMNATGEITGTPTASGYYWADYSIYDGVDLVGRRLNLSVFDLRFTTADVLPNATQNQTYSTVIAAAGGTPPYVFTSGGLPGGFMLSAPGNTSVTISGTPTYTGNRGFNITVTDANHVSYTRQMAIDIVGTPRTLPSISPYGNFWNDCTYGFGCQRSISVSNGGTAPFLWSATGLPPGMSIRPGLTRANNRITPGDGELWGVPTEIGTFNVTVTVTDAEGVSATNTFPLSVSRLYARDFDGTGTRGEPFATPGRYRRIRIIGGDSSFTPAYTATIVAGQLPVGLAFDAHTREVTGTPLENGSFGITLDVTDDANPANVLRTGQGLQIGGGTTTIGISSWDLGQRTIGQYFSYQLSACCIPNPSGYEWSLEPGSTLPSGLTLSAGGLISGTPAGLPGPVTFMVRAADPANKPNFGIRQLTLRLTTLAISGNLSLPFLNVGTSFSQTLTATGGSGTLTWTVSPDNYLPPGLTLSPGGVLSGIPAGTGWFSFTVQVADEAGSTAARTFTVPIYLAGAVPPLGLNIGPTFSQRIGTFTIQLLPTSVSGGVGPYTFSLTPGADAIPGMRVQNGSPFPTNFPSTALGGYMGVITEPGVYQTSIRVTDSRDEYFDRPITITTFLLTSLSSTTPPRAMLGVPYSFVMEPYGGSGNYYAWSATSLPPGLTIGATTGEISGTPTESGTYSPNVTITDLSASVSTGIGYTLGVDAYAIETNGMLAPATAGAPYSVTLSAPGCGPTCYWSITSGNLTNGLSLNSATGVISGANPTGPDSRTFTVRAAISQNSTTFAQKVFSMTTQNTYNPALTISSSVVPGDVTVGGSTSLGLYSVGGTPPYTWTLDSGVLPPGVALVGSAENYSANYGPGMYYLSGRAMAVGLYSFTLRVTDYVGATATKALTWSVSPLSFQYNNLPVNLGGSPPVIPNPLYYNQAYTQQLLVLGGTGGYPTWTNLSAMPPGLSLAAGTGVVSGTPLATGTVNTSFRVTDTGGNAIASNINFNVAGPTAVTLSFASGSSLGSISMGSSASINITPSGLGSTPPYFVTAVTPLPPGFSIVSAADGIVGGPTSGFSLLGIATAPGWFTFTLEARDSAIPPNMGARTFTLPVSPFTTLVGSALPDASVGIPFSQPLITFDNTGTATWTMAVGSVLPPGLSLVSGNTISGTPTQAGIYSFGLMVTDGTGLISQRTFTLNVSPLRINGNDILPAVTTGMPYSYTFTASGGSPTFGLATGYTLPSGLTLSSSGVLSGTQTSGSGSTTFIVTATEGTSSVSRRFLLPTVLPNPAVLSVALAGTVLSDATVGQSLSYVVSYSVSGGVPPYTFSVASGSTLPPGLQLVSGAGLIGYNIGTTLLAGIPSVANPYVFDLIVADTAGSQARRTFRLNVSPFGLLGSTSITILTGASQSLRFAGAGGTAPYAFTMAPVSATQDMLPPGLTLSSGGLLSGATTSSGVYSFFLRVQDAAGKTLSRQITVFVNTPGGLRVTTVNPGDIWVGGYISRNLATNITGSYTWSVVAGALPPGTSLLRNTAAPPVTSLVGAPSAPGIYTFTLRAAADTDPTAVYADHEFTLRVGTAQLVTPPWALVNILDVPVSGQAGTPYSFAFKAAGGTPPYRFDPSPFAPLPPGLTLSTGGVLSGTPASMGSYTISMIVTDAAGYATGIGGLTLIVAPAGAPPPLIRSGSINYAATVGVPFAFALDITLRGGTPPFTWSLAPGSSLPPGLSIVPGANGVSSYIAGTPASSITPAVFPFYATVTDFGGQSLTTYMSLSVSAMTISPVVLPPAVVGTPYSQTLVASGGLGPYSLQQAPTSDMPPGLSFSSSGVLSGTPTNAGIYNVYVYATDSTGVLRSRTLPIFVDNAAGQVPAVTLAPKPIQVYYEIGSSAPAAVPVTVAATSGAIPALLLFSGVPGASLSATSGTAPFVTNLTFNVSSLGAGTYTGLLAVGAPGAANLSDYAMVTLTVAPQPPCTYAVNPTEGSAPNTGGTGSFTVSAGGACGWTATASAPWITVTGGAAGSGSGTVNYSTVPNPDPAPRSATITVNGVVYTVTQFGTDCSFSISPAALSATAAGGTATVVVTASSGACGWTASSGSGLTVSPASGTGSGTVTVTVPAKLDVGSRVLTATIAGQPFSVSQSGIGCSVSLSPYSASVSAGASAGSVEVATPAGCTYDTVLGPSWITVTSGASGVGPDTLVYLVEPNSTTYSRTGSLTIGGQAFQITQAPQACSVTLDTTGLGSPFGVGAATGTIGVTANGANCSWSASSNVSWAAMTPSSGTGISSTISVSVLSNAASTVARAGELTIAGQTVNLTQAGTTCTFALESSSGSASASGGTASVRVIAPAACGWTSSTNNASWLTITSSGSAGTSAVQFSAAPNPSAAPRSGTLTIAGHTYTVDQAGAPCSFSITGSTTSPLLAADGATGQSFGFSATTTGCSPTAVSYSSWITIDATAFGGTSGSVTYSAAPNPYGTQRSGTIQVGNALFTVVQTGAACAYSLNAYGKVYRVAGGDDTLLGSATAEGCVPIYGTDQPSFITLGTLTGPVLNIFSLPYQVSPFTTSLTAVIRIGRVTFGGQTLTIKQLSW